ncbi:phytoene synthase, partial [Mangrovicoccus sp. HB182678]|nr:phytoene synthase [Mangrovicoccus algicola]
AAYPALLAGWQARGVLEQVRRDPERVAAGRLEPSPFRRDATLLLHRLRGW